MENISPSLLTYSSRHWGEIGLCPHHSIKIALLKCVSSLLTDQCKVSSCYSLSLKLFVTVTFSSLNLAFSLSP